METPHPSAILASSTAWDLVGQELLHAGFPTTESPHAGSIWILKRQGVAVRCHLILEVACLLFLLDEKSTTSLYSQRRWPCAVAVVIIS